jgi:tetratricopeptide (TPR) repeat protein
MPKLWTCAGLALALVPRAAAADEPTPTLDQKAQAQQHFTRAKALYESGNYKEALTELEAARALDPGAKDLSFNLGIVNERLGKLDDALKWFHAYVDMADTTPQERARAEAIIKRIEGAKREAPQNNNQPSAVVVQPPVRYVREETPPKGRIDGWTIASGATAVAGFAVGTIFAVKALGDKPKSGFVTGRDGSYADLQRSADDAHREAVVADIGFGVGVVFTVLTGYLFFSRPKVTSTPSSSARVSVAPTLGGSTLLLSGSF